MTLTSRSFTCRQEAKDHHQTLLNRNTFPVVRVLPPNDRCDKLLQQLIGEKLSDISKIRYLIYFTFGQIFG